MTALQISEPFAKHSGAPKRDSGPSVRAADGKAGTEAVGRTVVSGLAASWQEGGALWPERTVRVQCGIQKRQSNGIKLSFKSKTGKQSNRQPCRQIQVAFRFTRTTQNQNQVRQNQVRQSQNPEISPQKQCWNMQHESTHNLATSLSEAVV